MLVFACVTLFKCVIVGHRKYFKLFKPQNPGFQIHAFLFLSKLSGTACGKPWFPKPVKANIWDYLQIISSPRPLVVRQWMGLSLWSHYGATSYRYPLSNPRGPSSLMHEPGRTRTAWFSFSMPPPPTRHSDGTQCQRHPSLPSLPFTNTLLPSPPSLPSLSAAGRPRHGFSICAQRSLLYLHTLHIKGPFVMSSAHMTVRLSPRWKKRSLSPAIQPHPQHQTQPRPPRPPPARFSSTEGERERGRERSNLNCLSNRDNHQMGLLPSLLQSPFFSFSFPVFFVSAFLFSLSWCPCVHSERGINAL